MALGGRAIPTTTILSYFQQLAQLQRQYHREDRQWVENLSKDSTHPYAEAIVEEAELLPELFHIRPIQSSGENIFLAEGEGFFVKVHFNFWTKYPLDIINIDLKYSARGAFPGPLQISIDRPGNEFEEIDGSWRMIHRRRIKAKSVANVFVSRRFLCDPVRADYADYGAVTLEFEFISPRWFGINILRVVGSLAPGGRYDISELSMPASDLPW
jgi:hypothetical protein